MRYCHVTKQFRFEAAHFLPNHNGQCRRLHGHSYLLEVTFEGLIKRPTSVHDAATSDEGMVIDFKEISDLIKTHIIDAVDHQNLNEVIPFEFLPTTAENISHWIFTRLYNYLKNTANPIVLESVRVWETANAYAECRATDRRD